MDWFLYDNGLRHERVKDNNILIFLLNHEIFKEHFWALKRLYRATAMAMYIVHRFFKFT